MTAENREQAGCDVLPGHPGRQLRGDLDKTFAMGRNMQAMESLVHRTDQGFKEFYAASLLVNG